MTEVTLVWCDTSQLSREVSPSLQAHLPDAELHTWQSLRHPDRSWEFLVARVLLRNVLSQLINCAPKEVPIAIAKGGKPFLEGALASTGLEFNLSHSHGLVVVGWCYGAPVGVDVVRVGKVPLDAPLLARQYLLAQESAWVLAVPEEAELRFLSLFAQKEAFLKCSGSGLRVELSGAEAVLGFGPALDSRCFLTRLDTISGPAIVAAASADSVSRWKLFQTLGPLTLQKLDN
jgi:4'-phosphopantetheinyl transferase